VQTPPMNPQFLQALMSMMQQQGFGKAQADPYQGEPTPGGPPPSGRIYAGGPTPRYSPSPQPPQRQPPFYPGGYQPGMKSGGQTPPWQVGRPMPQPPWMTQPGTTRPAQMPPTQTTPGPVGGFHWQRPDQSPDQYTGGPTPGSPPPSGGIFAGYPGPLPPPGMIPPSASPLPYTGEGSQYAVGEGTAGGGVSTGGDGGGPTVDFSSIQWPQMNFNSAGYRPMEANRPNTSFGPPPMPGSGMRRPPRVPGGGNGGPSGGYTGW
jgi:hypothetical protein